jgi:hypothetical protein
MQGIDIYIRETNHVSSVYSVAAFLRLLTVAHIVVVVVMITCGLPP